MKNDKDKMTKLWEEAGVKVNSTTNKEHRIVDLYNRKSIGREMELHAAHCAARGVQPTFNVMLDWLYSKKRADERSDFVKISRLMEMVENNEIYPILILEVLNYALSVERSAIDVVSEMVDKCDDIESLKNLKKALSVRLKVDDENNDKTIDKGSN